MLTYFSPFKSYSISHLFFLLIDLMLTKTSNFIAIIMFEFFPSTITNKIMVRVIMFNVTFNNISVIS
jgi:hypothetical protein